MSIVKQEILRKITPYRDFYIKIPLKPKGVLDKSITCLFSVFYSRISQEVYDLIDINLQQGKNLINEGLLNLVTADDLIQGKVSTAWATGPIMEHLLEEKIPNTIETYIEVVGIPRNCFRDYSGFSFDFLVN